MFVAARAVTHAFGSRPPLFTGLDFVLHPGRTYALVGPSGSGKSTLLSVLAGWLTPSDGEIEWSDVTKVGWIFQNPHGVPARSALDHVMLPHLAKGMTIADAERRARDGLERLDLSRVADSPFRELSGGEGQRLMLARGLAAEPDLLLVDEPTAQLDPAAALTVSQALQGIATPGTIIVVATHDPHMRDVCTDVIDLAVAS